MSRNKITMGKRNKLIYLAYCERWGAGMRDNVIFPELHDIFHLEPSTLEKIVRKMRKQSQEAAPEIDFEKGDSDEN